MDIEAVACVHNLQYKYKFSTSQYKLRSKDKVKVIFGLPRNNICRGSFVVVDRSTIFGSNEWAQRSRVSFGTVMSYSVAGMANSLGQYFIQWRHNFFEIFNRWCVRVVLNSQMAPLYFAQLITMKLPDLLKTKKKQLSEENFRNNTNQSWRFKMWPIKRSGFTFLDHLVVHTAIIAS